MGRRDGHYVYDWYERDYLSAERLALGIVFIVWSMRLLLGHDGAAMKTFRYSIFYLMMLFICLLIDHVYLAYSF